MSIFKACDIRGTYPDELDEKIFYKIGRALPAILEGKHRANVLIAGDVRISTPPLKNSLARGLADAGAVVLDAGVIPTPAAYFAHRKIKTAALLIVTSSHNPAHYNGLKVMPGEMPITDEEIKELERATSEQDYREGEAPRPEKMEVLDDWKKKLIERFQGLRGKSSGLAVVVDAGNGCMSECAPTVLKELGFGVTELFCTPDGNFPNRQPNSAVEKYLSALKSKVRETGADVGVAFDGDGDRVSFIDETGHFLRPEEATVILMRRLFSSASKGGEKFVYDNKLSEMLRRECVRLGGAALAERSGHAYIKRRMITEDALFGAEVSGHYFYRELAGGDDALFSALFMLETILEEKRPLSELKTSVPAYFITEDIRIPLPADEQDLILKKIEEYWKDAGVSKIDGLKIFVERGWGLVRKSITEPLLTLRFEAKSEEDIASVIDEVLGGVPELKKAVRKSVR